MRTESGYFEAAQSRPGGNLRMKYEILDIVVLNRDLPESGLKSGDVGTVVELYDPDGIEVEFVTGAGTTQALVTLRRGDVHPVGREEMLSVRKLDAA